MIFCIKCFKLFMNFIYSFFKLFKIQNKVTFISRQSNITSIDFSLLSDELKNKYPDIKIVILNKRLEKKLINKINYFFHMFVQMYHIATSKVVVLDSYCIVISILKHKEQLKVIQMWHALGSLKKFGYSSLDKKDGRSSKIAKIMDMHKNYTYILTSSEVSKPFFKEAFNAKEEQMKIMSIPRVDFLQSDSCKNKVKKEFYEIYPEMNNEKKNILYCPTQRNDDIAHFEEVVKATDFVKYNLIIKLHDGKEYIYLQDTKIQRNTNFTGLELLHVADYVITDYSAIVYEAAIVEKPIYFYAYDYDKYIDSRGWYINYKSEMPGIIEKDICIIMEHIKENKWDKEKIINFRNKYIDDLSKNVTQKIVALIANIVY